MAIRIRKYRGDPRENKGELFISFMKEITNPKEVFQTRIDAVENKSSEMIVYELGTYLGGKLTLAVEFDLREEKEN